MAEETVIWRPFSYEATATLSNLSLDVIANTSPGKPPKWIDEVDNSSEQSVFTPTFINVMTHLHRLLQDTLQSYS